MTAPIVDPASKYIVHIRRLITSRYEPLCSFADSSSAVRLAEALVKRHNTPGFHGAEVRNAATDRIIFFSDRGPAPETPLSEPSVPPATANEFWPDPEAPRPAPTGTSKPYEVSIILPPEETTPETAGPAPAPPLWFCYFEQARAEAVANINGLRRSEREAGEDLGGLTDPARLASMLETLWTVRGRIDAWKTIASDHKPETQAALNRHLKDIRSNLCSIAGIPADPETRSIIGLGLGLAHARGVRDGSAQVFALVNELEARIDGSDNPF